MTVHVRGVFIGYAVLCCGLLTAQKRAVSGSWPDYSYGMYIYAFPVMLLVHAFMGGDSYWVLSAVTFLATLPFAVASWHLVEKPVLEAVRRGRERQRLPAGSKA